MGRSIDLYSYDYEKLLNKTIKICETDDKELVERILLTCGNKVGDRYIILNQELWEDSSCYFNVTNALERIFEVDDVFGKVFCVFGDKNVVDRQSLIGAIDLYEIYEKIDIDIPEDEY